MNKRRAELMGGMSIELGTVGIWRHPSGLPRSLWPRWRRWATEPSGWAARRQATSEVVERLLDATDRIAIATGIVNVW